MPGFPSVHLMGSTPLPRRLGALAWFDPRRGLTFSSGSLVSGWTDVIGGYQVTQGDATHQLSSGSWGTRTCLSATGTNVVSQNLGGEFTPVTASGSLALATALRSTDFTIATVVKANNYTISGMFFGLGIHTDNTKGLSFGGLSTSGNPVLQNNGSGSTAVSPVSWGTTTAKTAMMTFSLSGTQAKGYQDNNLVITRNSISSSAWTVFIMAANGAFSFDTFNGKVGPYVIVPRVLNSTDQAQLHTWLLAEAA